MTITAEQDEMLKKAKALYPPGTKYICPSGLFKQIFIIEKDDEFRFTIGGNVDALRKGYLYYSGNSRWAKIVVEVPIIEIELYQIY